MEHTNSRSCAWRALLAVAVCIAVTAQVGVADAQQGGVRYLEPVFTGVDVTRDVAFGHAVNDSGKLEVLRLDMHEPAGDTKTNRPVIVFAHGGGFGSGDKNEKKYEPYLQGMAQRGYVLLNINYRLQSSGGGVQGGLQKFVNLAVGDDPAIRNAQHDMQAAVRWARTNAAELGINPDMIVASGGSAGGIMAWQTANNPEDPGTSGNPGASSKVAAAVSFWGAADSDNIEADAPPVINFHGALDTVVPLPLALASCAQAIRLGRVCEQTIWPDAQHSPWDRIDEILVTAPNFLCRHVIKTCSAPEPLAPVTIGSIKAPDPQPPVTKANAPADASTEAKRYIDPLFTAVTVTPNLTYGAAVNNLGEQQSLEVDLYEPSGDTAVLRPVVIWAHGGGFKNGTKATAGSFLTPFAERGYVGVALEYRLRPPGTPGSASNQEIILDVADGHSQVIQEAQHDMQAAVRWLRANASRYRLDPDRIVVAGSSAGGITALESAFNPEDPGSSGTPGVPSSVAAAISVSGASDVRRIEPGAPPVLMFHGTNDPTVPFPLAAETCTGTTALMNTCEFVPWPGGDHSAVGDHKDEVIATASDFMCRHVVASCAP